MAYSSIVRETASLLAEGTRQTRAHNMQEAQIAFNVAQQYIADLSASEAAEARKLWRELTCSPASTEPEPEWTGGGFSLKNPGSFRP